MQQLGLDEFLFLMHGLKWTLLLTIIGLVGGIAFGLLVAVARVVSRARCGWSPPPGSRCSKARRCCCNCSWSISACRCWG